jgi:ketosteroid isomerase-like protein
MTTTATTQETIQQYFDSLQGRGDWGSLLADDVIFTSHAGPGRQISGRDAFLQGTRGFYAMIANTQLRDIMVDGEKACALTRYRLQPPNGRAAFESDIAEIFTVRRGKISSFEIYFDTAPYPR